MIKISVLMSVYNTEKMILEEAVNSIKNQTIAEWELVIIDDHSTNTETIEYLEYLKGEKIFVYRNGVNMGLTKSLNIGLKYCHGNFIARMDADDISMPDRLEKQMKYMEKHSFDIIGSYYGLIPQRRFKHFATESIDKQKIRMVFGNSGIIHSSAMWRREVFEEKNIYYNEDYKKSQDYGLWCECLDNNLAIGICDEQLVLWRESENQITKIYSDEQQACKHKIRMDYLKRNFNVTDMDLDFWKQNIDDVLSDRENINIKKCEALLMLFVKNNESYSELIAKEVYRYWFVQAVYRLKHYKKIDMIFSRLFWKTLLPKNLIYIYKGLRSELVIEE